MNGISDSVEAHRETGGSFALKEETMESHEAVRAILKEAVSIAADEGRREEARLGRALTEAEAERLADMVIRQLKTAVAIAR